MENILINLEKLLKTYENNNDCFAANTIRDAIKEISNMPKSFHCGAYHEDVNSCPAIKELEYYKKIVECGAYHK